MTASTAERPVSRAHDEIVAEAQRIEEAALYSSKGHFKAAEMWGLFHLGFGLAIVILAAIAGAKAFSKLDTNGIIAGWLSILVAVLSSVTTFLSPHKKQQDHLSAGNEYEALRNRVRIFRTIECWGDSSDATLSAALIKFAEDKDSVNRASPQISFLAYRLAKFGIDHGEGDFKVDAKPQNHQS